MYQLAQLNVATALDDMDSDRLKAFVEGLDAVNAIAELSEGFIWRLKDDSGNATDIQVSDNPRFIVNMSVWESADHLKNFMFKTLHVDFLKRKKEWFENPSEANYVLWWIPKGHIPTLDEAFERLAMLRENGDSVSAFSFRKIFQPE